MFTAVADSKTKQIASANKTLNQVLLMLQPSLVSPSGQVSFDVRLNQCGNFYYVKVVICLGRVGIGLFLSDVQQLSR